MTEHRSLFVPHGDRFVSTEASGNPWGELTGGGPVAGLLSRAVERHLADQDDMQVVRATFDLMRPVPHVPLEVRARTVRRGKRLHVVEAGILADGVELARATAQALLRTDLGTPLPRQPPTYPGPDELTPGQLLPSLLGPLRWGVHDVVDVRWVSDQLGGSPSGVWMRMPLPLLPDEDMSPLVHTAVLADCVNAAAPLSTPPGPYINSDITLYLHRELGGEWLGMEVERDVEVTGIGTARALLSDVDGPIGSATEAVLVNQLG